MYDGKNTLIRASVDRREACSPDVILSKNSFFDSLKRPVSKKPYRAPTRWNKSRRSGFLMDDFDTVVVTAAAADLMGSLQLAAVGASGQGGGTEFPNRAASFVSSSLGYFSLRDCHCKNLLLGL